MIQPITKENTAIPNGVSKVTRMNDFFITRVRYSRFATIQILLFIAIPFYLANKYFIDGRQYFMERLDFTSRMHQVLQQMVGCIVIRDFKDSLMIRLTDEFQATIEALRQCSFESYFIQVLFK